MIRKKQKLISYSLVSSFIVFSLFFNTSVFAAEKPKLEVIYPQIGDYTLTASAPLPDFAIYLFYAGMLIGFAAAIGSLVWGGVIYLLNASVQTKIDAKDRIFGAISGILILVLTYLIITTINPELAVLKSEKLEEEKMPEVPARSFPGVYFYEDALCEDKTVKPSSSSISDFKELKNKITSAKIVNDSENDIYYTSILYTNPNFYGDCVYLNPNDECNPNLKPPEGSQGFSSASIYQFSPDALYDEDGLSSNSNKIDDTNGVYFFRKPCLDDFRQNTEKKYSSIEDVINYCKKLEEDRIPIKGGNFEVSGLYSVSQANKIGGGWYMIKDSEIKNLNSDKVFTAKLKNLKFNDVPHLEKDCKKYDLNDECTAYEPPSLSGENISSIIIKGDYAVIIYKEINGEMRTCMEFPKLTDVSGWGPRQIKWEMIRNTNKPLPDTIMIIPLKSKKTP